MKTQSLVLLTAALLGQTSFAGTGAKTYGYLPGASIVMGQGFSISSPLASTAPCLENPRAFTNPNRDIGQETAVTMQVVTSTSALKTVLGIDTEMDASVLSFSGGGSLDFSSDIDITENDATVVIQGRTQYGDDLLDLSDLKYIPNAQTLIDKGNLEGFKNLCGNELISQVSYGNQISIVVSIHGLTDDEKISINSSAQASGGFDVLSASARSKINSMIEHSSTSTDVRMQAFVRGGEGLPDLKDLVAETMSNNPNLDQLAHGISNIFQQLTPQNAAVIGFTTQPYPGVDLSDVNLMGVLKTQFLESLVTRFRGFDQEYLLINNDLIDQDTNNETPADFEGLASSMISSAKLEVPKMASYLGILTNIHAACLADTTPELGACTAPARPITPNMDEIYWHVTNY